MSPHGGGGVGVGAGSDAVRRSPLGIVGPGASSPGPERKPPEGAGEGRADFAREPRRFVVPGPRESEGDASAGALAGIRRLVREGGILLGAEQTSLFLFDEPERGPVRRLVRFRLTDRRFEPPAVHPPALGREVRTFLSGVSRAEVSDVGEQAPPPGAMRDYLVASGVRGLLSLPLRREDRIVGFVSFESTSGPRRWSAGDRERAQQAVLRIENALPEQPDPAELWEAALRRATGDTASASPRAAGTLPGAPVFPRSAPPEPGPRSLETRLPRLRPLEGAALVGAELGRELLHLVDVQDSTLELLDGLEGEAAEVVEDLRRISADLRKGMGTVVDATRAGVAGEAKVDVGGVLSSALPRLAALTGDDVRLEVSPFSEALPVRGDAALIERMARHLLENARRAVGPAGRIRMSWDRIRREPDERASAEEPAAFARIRVEDDGRGIRPEHLPWIFEPYFTAGEKGAGRGLGLSTVQAVVEGHGGWVDVRSRVGEGTLVSVHLPLSEVASKPSARREDAGPTVLPRVLVIEDEPALGRLLVRVLEREGYEVKVASSAPAARRLWVDGEGAADLVLLERRISGEGEGPSFARAWKRERPDLRVVLVDRGGDPATPPPGDPWIDAVLRPPFRPEEIVRAAREQLAHNDRTRAGESSEASPGLAWEHPDAAPAADEPRAHEPRPAREAPSRPEPRDRPDPPSVGFDLPAGGTPH